MSSNNEIKLEPFFNEEGVLLVRCKETKRIVSDLQIVRVREAGLTYDLKVEIELSVRRYEA